MSSSSTALRLLALQEAHGGADDVGVEAAAQALVRGDHHEQDALARPLLEQGMGVRVGARGHAVQDLQHLPGVGPRGEHGVLGPAQLGRRDHLHGLGDLLRVLDRADPPPDVDEGGHGGSRPAFSAGAAGLEDAGELLERGLDLLGELALDVLLLRHLLRTRVARVQEAVELLSRSAARSETG